MLRHELIIAGNSCDRCQPGSHGCCYIIVNLEDSIVSKVKNVRSQVATIAYKYELGVRGLNIHVYVEPRGRDQAS